MVDFTQVNVSWDGSQCFLKDFCKHLFACCKGRETLRSCSYKERF